MLLILACGPVVAEDTDGGGGMGDAGNAGSNPDDDDDGVGQGGTVDDAEWPDGFDPRGDVGDHTLREPVLLVVQTDLGPLFVHVYAERLGDGFQAWATPATYDGAWEAVGEPLRESGSDAVVDNEVRVGFVDMVFPPGLHPFGPDEARVDLFLDVRFYDDRLLCGFVELDLFFSDDMDQTAPFVAVPIDLTAGQAEPNPSCG